MFPPPSISPIKNDDGAITGYVAVKEEITDRKKIEEKLRKTMADMKNFNKAAVGREMRMIELKRDINHLLEERGDPARYNVSFTDE